MKNKKLNNAATWRIVSAVLALALVAVCSTAFALRLRKKRD